MVAADSLENVMACKSKVKILLVDDQSRNLDALAVVLDNPKYELVFATSGQEAIQHLYTHEFAVVLLDVMMPNMDGFETARTIRSSKTCFSTPIIFVSAVADELDFVYKGYGAGAVDYIVKPIVPAVVKAKVAVFAELFEARRLLTVQLEETRTLCNALEKDNAEKQRKMDDVIEQLRMLVTRFETRIQPDTCTTQKVVSQPSW